METKSKAPVIPIDGPSGVGKGTLSVRLAQTLGWHLMPSGDVYRVLAYLADMKDLSPDEKKDVPSAVAIVKNAMRVRFNIGTRGVSISINDAIVDDSVLRDEQMGNAASKWSAYPDVRKALLGFFRYARQEPGLIYEGRDGGTVVFPNERLKIYLEASPEVRAERIAKRLRLIGKSANVAEIIEGIKQRDARDSQRATAPLRPAHDALRIKTDRLTPEQVFSIVLDEVESRKLAH